ncbi:MAG: hypothetical protein IM638_09855 [Bacteroidetes bacterium]|nr:hypothetical protein [Bacteroidota bacterium]
MKKLFTILLVLCCAKTVWSQIPGYQGKRLLISYSGQTFIRYDRDEFLNIEDGFVMSTRFSWRNELNLSYVVSRKSTLGISAFYARPNATCNYESVSFNYVNPQSGITLANTASVNINEFDKPGSLRFTQFGAAVNWQFFPNKYIAPVGTYHQFSVGFMMARIPLEKENEIRLKEYPTWQGSNSFQAVLTEPYKFSCARFSYHLGRQNPIGKNIYLNTAIGIVRFYGNSYVSTNLFSDGSTSYGSILKLDEYLNNMISRNLLRTQMFEIKFGIGFIK